jgi:hypothetical protein
VRRLREGYAPRAGLHLVDADGQRPAGARAANLDRAGERVPGVDRRVARGKLVARVEVPARVWDGDTNRVAWIDREHRLEVARKVSVQVALLERELVDHCISLFTASTTRATDGM